MYGSYGSYGNGSKERLGARGAGSMQWAGWGCEPAAAAECPRQLARTFPADPGPTEQGENPVIHLTWLFIVVVLLWSYLWRGLGQSWREYAGATWFASKGPWPRALVLTL